MDEETKSECRMIRKALDAHKSILDVLERHMYGTAKDDPGIVTRIDRLEQKAHFEAQRGAGHSKFVIAICAVISALIAGLVQVVVALIHRGL